MNPIRRDSNTHKMSVTSQPLAQLRRMTTIDASSFPRQTSVRKDSITAPARSKKISIQFCLAEGERNFLNTGSHLPGLILSPAAQDHNTFVHTEDIGSKLNYTRKRTMSLYPTPTHKKSSVELNDGTYSGPNIPKKRRPVMTRSVTVDALPRQRTISFQLPPTDDIHGMSPGDIVLEDIYKNQSSLQSDISDLTQGVERTPEADDPENRQRWISLAIIYLINFLMVIQKCLFRSSLWPFLSQIDPDANENFFGFVIMAFNLGSAIGSTALGILSNKIQQTRVPIILGLTFMVLGNLILAFVENLPVNRRWLMLTARFLTGFGVGNSATIFAYIAMASKLQERSRAIALQAAINSVAQLLGPAIQIGFVSLSYPGFIRHGWLHINMYTAAAFTNATIGTLSIVIMALFFKEYWISVCSDDKLPHKPQDHHGNESDENGVEQENIGHEENDNGPINKNEKYLDNIEECESDLESSMDSAHPRYEINKPQATQNNSSLSMNTTDNCVNRNETRNNTNNNKHNDNNNNKDNPSDKLRLQLPQANQDVSKPSPGSIDGKGDIKDEIDPTPNPSIRPFDKVAVVVSIYVRMVCLFCASYDSTIGSAFTMVMFNWTRAQAVYYNGIIAIVSGVINVPFNLFMGFVVMKKIAERVLIMFGFVSFLLFFLLTFSWPCMPAMIPADAQLNHSLQTNTNGKITTRNETKIIVGNQNNSKPEIQNGMLEFNQNYSNPQRLINNTGLLSCKYSWCYYTTRVHIGPYIIACFCILTAFGLAYTPNNSMYSKILGPRKQGGMHGVSTCSGQIAITISPVLCSYLFEFHGPRVGWAVAFGVLASAFVVVGATFRRLVPWEDLTSEDEEKAV